MKKLVFVGIVCLFSFNVGANEKEIYSCSFDERVNHILEGDGVFGRDSEWLNKRVDIVKKGDVETATYIIDGDKAFVKTSFGKVEATFLRTSFQPSNWQKPIVHNVSFTERVGLFPSSTIISGDFATRITVFEEPAFKGVTVFSSYGKCIKTK